MDCMFFSFALRRVRLRTAPYGFPFGTDLSECRQA